MVANLNSFTTIRTEGLLLPPDLLQRIAEGDTSLEGLTSESYHRSGEKLNELINQSWNALQGIWANFKTQRDRLPESDLGTTLTRERWLLPLFRELDYGRLTTASADDFTIEGKHYPISHKSADGHPIHLVSYQIDLDKRPLGSSTASPHSLVQVLLNRDEALMWGFVSNGYKLRILRDNASLTRQAYVEFDLQAMMDGEIYSDFVLVWLLCHQSRIENGRESWLEKWAQTAQQQGTRALDQLRDGVQAAIEALGVGFLDHPSNTTLRDTLQSGDLSAQDYYRQLLRLVYRLLVMFTAEDRELLYDPSSPESARERYTQHYSMRRLRRIAEKLKGTRHSDLYESLRLIMRLLAGEQEGADKLGLPVLDSFLFRDDTLADLIHSQIANGHLLNAVRALAFVEDPKTHSRRAVDYRNLGPEELGSVYESLLELHPQINIAGRAFALATAGGNERKTTGSYYTPTSLINALLDSALDPVIAEARKQRDPESALLALKVCDPACGSGHFLIAAAHRIARELARVRTGEETASPHDHRAALRDVISRCIYGVDINPMAVELCKVNLWMEAMEAGKPLSFLEGKIQVGNSLLGTTPRLMREGIPDDAFNPIEGDDKKIATELKKKNREARKEREKRGVGQLDFFATLEPPAQYAALTRAAAALNTMDDDTVDEVRRKEEAWASLLMNSETRKARLLADAWCAAFVWEKAISDGTLPMTDLTYRRLEDTMRDHHLYRRDQLDLIEKVEALRDQYAFFHWHVAFPDVFAVPDDPADADNEQTGWTGGFDCVLGNPPWDQIQLDDREFFAVSAPDIANALNMSNRKKMLEALAKEDPSIYASYIGETRRLDGIKHFAHASGRYPTTSFGRLNSAPLFAELSLGIFTHSGRVGLIVPTGIATDSFNQYFFSHLIKSNLLVRLYSFENEEFIFPGVHHSFKFCLLTLGLNRTSYSEFTFFIRRIAQLVDEDRHFTLSAEDFALLSPNTGTTPIFRSKRDAEITKIIYQSCPVLMNESGKQLNPWNVSFKLMFMMNTDSHLFETSEVLQAKGSTLRGNIFIHKDHRHLPLYEGRMIHHYNHRVASVGVDEENMFRSGVTLETKEEDYINPDYTPLPRYWVDTHHVTKAVGNEYSHQWFLGFRDVSSAISERTAIFSVIPAYAVGNKVPLLLIQHSETRVVNGLVANLSAFVFDYVARQKMGGMSLNFFIVKQLPVLPPSTYTPDLLAFIVPRVLELTYTAWDLQPFAQDVGYDGPPFVWDEERRFLMRCELDALYFHLYGITRDDVDYIMNTFPIVRRKDEAKYDGVYRTKETILAMYDAMAASGGVVGYQTHLTPPPADSRVAHRVE